jgi:hypothetical protein
MGVSAAFFSQSAAIPACGGGDAESAGCGMARALKSIGPDPCEQTP